MRKFKPYKILCLTLGVAIAISGGTVVQAASTTKTLKAIYNNIAVSYNGQLKSLTTEPFSINGSVYVPLRAVGEIMGANLTWANNTVYITNNTSSVASEQELAAKNFQIASLTQQLDAAKKELETLKGTGTSGTGTSAAGSNLNTTAVNNTLKQIEDDYADEYKIDWDFDLSISSGRLELTVSYDSKYDKDDFADLSESKRKQLIKNICYDIAGKHSDVEIRGTIVDSRDDTEKADFKYSKTGSLDYEESSIYSLSDFEDELDDHYKTISCGGFTLNISSIKLSERRNELTFDIYTSLTPSGADYRTNWNSLTQAQKDDIERLMDDIYDDLEDEYSNYDEIVGVIRDSSRGSIGIYEDEEFERYTVSTS